MQSGILTQQKISLLPGGSIESSTGSTAVHQSGKQEAEPEVQLFTVLKQ
jgi:hypothetical protein